MAKKYLLMEIPKQKQLEMLHLIIVRSTLDPQMCHIDIFRRKSFDMTIIVHVFDIVFTFLHIHEELIWLYFTFLEAELLAFVSFCFI